MSRIAYVNGRYLPHRQASVHVEDRGYQFADGVYEVCAVVGGRIVDLDAHLDRLGRSLGELAIPWPMPRTSMAAVMAQVVRRNRVVDGIVYLQVTRGVARREHVFPDGLRPSLVMTARPAPFRQLAAKAAEGVSVITVPDIRWGRCDIKSVSLLPNALARQQAKAAGAYEAWLVDGDGFVTEGAATNAWIVDGEGNLVTRQLESAILSGITRAAVMDLARLRQLRVVERKFTVAEAQAAREAFLTSTTSFVMPVVAIDGVPVGDGRPGRLSGELRTLYQRHAAEQPPADLAGQAVEHAAD